MALPALNEARAPTMTLAESIAGQGSPPRNDPLTNPPHYSARPAANPRNPTSNSHQRADRRSPMCPLSARPTGHSLGRRCCNHRIRLDFIFRLRTGLTPSPTNDCKSGAIAPPSRRPSQGEYHDQSRRYSDVLLRQRVLCGSCSRGHNSACLTKRAELVCPPSAFLPRAGAPPRLRLCLS